MAQTDLHSSVLQLLASSVTGQTADPFWTRKQSRVGGAMRKWEEWVPRRILSAQHTLCFTSAIYTLLSRCDLLLTNPLTRRHTHTHPLLAVVTGPSSVRKTQAPWLQALTFQSQCDGDQQQQHAQHSQDG